MTDTMLFGILKMPFEMAMKDEISRLQYYSRVQELVGRFEAQQKAEPVPHAVIVGALFDFMGWLTTRDERLVLSGADEAGPAADAIKVFAEMRGLSLADARVQDWQNYTTQQQAEPIGWLDGNDKLAYFMHRDLKAEHDKRGSSTPREFTIPVYSTALEQSESSAQRTLRQLGYTDCGGEFWKPPLGKAAQPEQQAEPVAWLHPANSACVTTDPTAYSRGIPLYTAPPKQQAEPPQRQWVGLTEEEIARTLGIKTHLLAVIRDARAIEAKKEKNT